MGKTDTWMNNYSLSQVESAFHEGLLAESEVEEYIKRWNANPGRLTQATFSGYNIYNK